MKKGLKIGLIVGGSVVGAMVLLSVIAGIASSSSGGKSSSKAKQVYVIDGTVEFKETDRISDSIFYSLTGKIKNDTSKQLSSVYIEANFYNAANEQIGYSNDLTSNLGAGETWIFKMSEMSDAVIDSYRFTELRWY